MAKKNTPVARPMTSAARPISEKTTTKTLIPRTGGPYFDASFWKKNLLPVLILISSAVGLYFQANSFGYVLDDSLVIEDNRFTKQGFSAIDSIFSTESMTGYFGQQKDLVAGGRYRPLSIATFAAEVGFLKNFADKDKPVKEILNPHVSHFINSLLYGLTGALLFGVLLALFHQNERKWWFSVAFWAALLFVFHPLHTEVVANIKGRDEILALLGALGSLWFALKYYEKNQLWWLFGAFLSFWFGVFSKENAIAFAVVIPMTGYFFTKATNRQLWISAAVLAVGAAIFLIVRTNVIGYFMSSGKQIQDLMNNPFVGMKGGERLATTFLTLGWYLKLLVLPHPLTHDYYPYHVPKVGWSDWRAPFSLLIYVGLAVFALRNLTKRSIISWAILFYLGTLFIVSNIPFSIGAFMNERFIYMSSVAFCVIIAWFFIEKLPILLKFTEDSRRFAGIAVLALMLGLYGFRTITRVPDWKDALSLNGSSIETSPESARAQCFVAVALFENVYRPSANKMAMRWVVDSMENCINRSLAIYPNYSSALTMKPGIVAERYDFDKDLPRLLNDFSVVLERRPSSKFIEDYVNYLKNQAPEQRGLLVEFCRKAGLDIAFKKFRNPNFANRWLNIGYQIDPTNAAILAAINEVKNK
jgi:protein O-mannosyl-transferase